MVLSQGGEEVEAWDLPDEPAMPLQVSRACMAQHRTAQRSVVSACLLGPAAHAVMPWPPLAVMALRAATSSPLRLCCPPLLSAAG